MKKTLLLFSSLFCFAFLALFSSLSAKDERAGIIVDAVAAQVDAEVITMADVFRMTSSSENKLRAQFGNDISRLSPQQRKQFEQQIVNWRREALNSLIEKELLYLEFKRRKATIPQSYLQERINQAIQKFTQGDEIKFEELLSQEGMTMRQFREKMEKNLAAEMLTQEVSRRGIMISDEAIQKYYDENKAGMSSDREVQISVILLKLNGKYGDKLQETADLIQKKLKEGTPFADVAKDYSEGANAENGGLQDWAKDLAKPLENAVRPLKVGEYTQKPVKIGSNFYFVQLTGLRGEGPALTEELREEIRYRLEDAEANRRYRDFIASLYIRYPVVKLAE